MKLLMIILLSFTSASIIGQRSRFKVLDYILSTKKLMKPYNAADTVLEIIDLTNFCNSNCDTTMYKKYSFINGLKDSVNRNNYDELAKYFNNKGANFFALRFYEQNGVNIKLQIYHPVTGFCQNIFLRATSKRIKLLKRNIFVE